VRLLSPLVLALCLIITAMVILMPVVPLGVAGTNSDGTAHAEWVWQRHVGFINLGDLIGRLLPAILGGGFLFGISVYGVRRIPSVGPVKTSLLYAMLIIATGFWFGRVQQTAPLAHQEAKPYWVVYDPSASGYFFEATYRMRSVEDFLANYESRMAEGEVLHVGTHPPGLFLLAKGCLTVCETSPWLVSWLQSIERRSSRDSFRYLERTAALTNLLTAAERNDRIALANKPYDLSLTPSELAALQLMSELSTVALAFAILPIALLCHVLFDRVTVWRVCCLWATLPCLAIFAPKSDVLFPLTCTTVLALAVVAMANRSQAAFALAVPAGIVLWLGLLMSLAHLPVLAVLTAFIVIRGWQSNGKSLPRDILILSTTIATVVALSLWWNFSTGCSLQNVWRMNLGNHAGFYDQFPRTWWKWLLVNPIELAFAIGLPLFVVAIAGATRAARDLITMSPQVTVIEESTNSASKDSVSTALCIAAALTWGALWLSGKNQGEAARLWCFLTPWLLIMAGRFLSKPNAAAENANDRPANDWRFLLITQLIVGTLTVMCVSGFSF
jgi:methylthioxylose transferase